MIFLWTLFVSTSFGVLSTVRPVLIQLGFDNYIVNSNHLHIGEFELNFTHIICVIFLFLCVEALFQFIFIYRSNYLAQKIIHNLRIEVFSKITRLPIQHFDTTPTGSLITRVVSDMEAIAAVFSQGFLVIFGDIFKMLLIITCMFFVNSKLALISLSFLPFLIIATIIFQKYMHNAFSKVRKYISKMNVFIYENIIGVHVVQIFAQEKNAFESFKKINSQHRDAHIKTVLYFSVFLPIVDVCSAIAMGVLVWFGASSILDFSPTITIGQIIAFILFINMLFRPLRAIADRLNVLQMGSVAAARVFDLLDLQIKKNNYDVKYNGRKSLMGEILFKDVSFEYKKNERVLSNLNFAIASNETLAIVGPTGSGKTTMINLLMKWYTPTNGKIYINNIDFKNISVETLRSNFGIVLQNSFFLSDTLMENIKFFNQISDEEVMNAVSQIGLSDFINQFPGKYSYHVGERGSSLSEGEKQLVSFLRTYLINPSYLILDEATSSMDPLTEILIQKTIKKIAQDRTAIIIAHRLSTIRSADKIILLENGKILEYGSHKELMDSKGEYYEYYNQQFVNG